MSQSNKIKESLLVISLMGILFYLLTRQLPILYTVLIIGLAGLAFPALGALIHTAWSALTHWIGRINTAVLLTLIYWIVLTPVAFIYKRSGKKGIILKRPGESNFRERNHTFESKDLLHPW